MSLLLAAEGGFQDFVLHPSEKDWLWFALGTGVISLIAAFGLMRNVLRYGTGTSLMAEIAGAVQEGAEAFLRRQFRTIGIVVVPLAVLVFFTATKVVAPPGKHGLTFAASGLARAVAFVVGAFFSGLTGTIGMSLAVRGNVRTAAAALDGKLPPALKVAFRTGGITGLFCVGLGLIGASAITLIFQNSVTAVLEGFGFGGSLLALFMRVGGGIFTKAADVGADLVGKVEVGIPEDDPRNAAVIADNVGDNVGDCAGMAADLFESYAVTIVASLILGYAAFVSLGRADTAKGLIYPLVVAGFGILASIVGIFSVRASDRDRTAMTGINRGYRISGLLTVIAAFLVAQFYIKDLKVFWAVLVGVGLGQVASLITEYFTSTETSPVREIADSARTGPATTILAGISIGLESSVWAIVSIAVALGVAIALGGGNIELTLYLVALIGIGLLSTTGMVVSEDSFGPVSDNAAGIAEMAGEFGGEAQRVMVSLDAVGNTTKAITKGVAIASAVIATVALFAAFIETIANQLNLPAGGASFRSLATQINVANPTTFVGLLVGGSVAFLFSGLAIRAVGRSAGTVVQEVRRQFREHPGIMDRTERPEYGRVIAICTAAAQRELVTPALLAVLAPVIIGFGINYFALGAFLAAAILTGQLMANFLSNSGGAWDNAKKYIEDGNLGGKGSEAHKAAVIGDTVGDPFKDTAGPALNPLIKVMNLVSLLILPEVIKLHVHTATRYAISGACLAVLLGAVTFSKRATESIAGHETDLPPAQDVGVSPTEVIGHH
ncbi:MAG TPA: sodium-translocating pyrophosphatase [Acidimicrobiales bacterium]|nr:sodium-translocating pyrophosphatase [Acidimicrobiales bacterium]